ncbi:MAG TPA: hypothetical protein VFA95_00735 [Gammaproteobacteria bacterium]|nr:hypothetical protein [Gammaproteobacteria bacterium]
MQYEELQVRFPAGVLRSELRLRTAHIAPSDLVRLMGYANARKATLDRIARVLDDPWLGLADGGFDFRYGSREFLEVLCRTVGIEDGVCQRGIVAIEREIDADRRAYKPWLFVDTGFRREDHPGMSLTILGLIESARRLRFPDGFWRLSLTGQLARARQRVCEHMAATGGELPVRGTIRGYWFVHREWCAIELSPDGEVLGETDRFNPAGATAHIRRRRIDPDTLLGGSDQGREG